MSQPDELTVDWPRTRIAGRVRPPDGCHCGVSAHLLRRDQDPAGDDPPQAMNCDVGPQPVAGVLRPGGL